MELRHLRYFSVAGDEQHFGRAAKRLFVTPSAVSQLMAQLEKELGFGLFEREGRGLRLSAAGRSFHSRIKDLFLGFDQAVELGRRVSIGEAGILRIGYAAFGSGRTLTRDVLNAFRSTHPDVGFDFQEMGSSQIVDALARGDLDAGFLYPSTRKSGFNYCTLSVEPMAIAFPSRHAYCHRRTLRLSDLKDDRFITLSRRAIGPGYDRILECCLKAGFRPNIVQEADNGTTLINLVSSGMGITFMIKSAEINLPPGLIVKRVQGLDLNLAFELVWRSDHKDPALSSFVGMVQERVKGHPSR